MKTQDLIQEILKKNPLISHEQLQQKLQAERLRTGGLLSEETLLRLIAAKLGVKVPQNTMYNSGILPISRLFAGLYDVNVAGKLIAVFPVKNFQSTEKSGKLASLMLTDKEGILRVVLWNEKAELVEKGKLRAGQTVRLMHGYTREDRYGKIELHMSKKSQIELELEDKTDEYPSIKEFTTKIKNLSNSSGNVNIMGEIKKLLHESSFIRNDTSVGKITRLILADESGEVTVVFWNEKTTELETTLKANAHLILINARVKQGQNDSLEVHVDSNTFVEVKVDKPPYAKISQLVEDQIISIEGVVSTLPETKEVTTSKGETIKLTVFNLNDQNSSIRVSAWREQAEALEELKIGDKVILENVYVKKGFEAKIELTTRSTTITSIVRT